MSKARRMTHPELVAIVHAALHRPSQALAGIQGLDLVMRKGGKGDLISQRGASLSVVDAGRLTVRSVLLKRDES